MGQLGRHSDGGVLSNYAFGKALEDDDFLLPSPKTLPGSTELLPARASEQGNVIGSVRIYIYVCTKKIVIERTSDLIYLNFVATDFFPKIISPSAGEKSVTQRIPCYSAIFALLMNPLPDHSNYSPLLLHPLPHSGSILH